MKIKQPAPKSSITIGNLTEKPLLRFAVVGAISTITDLIVLNLSGLFINIYLATTLGFLSGLTVGYFLNSNYVFRSEQTIHRYGRYGLTSAIGWGTTIGIMYGLHDVLGWRALAAKLVAVVVVFIWNYNLSRLWAFR